MLHPWLCKYSAKARASAEHLRSISLSNETLAMQSTISTSSALRPVTVVTPETIPSAVPIIVGEATPPKPEIKQAEQVEEEEEEEHEHLQIPTTLEPIPDDDSLPNLVERVWSIRPESSLFHRNRLIKAFRTVQAARRLSTKKVGEDARRGSGDSTGTTGSLDRRVATEPNIRNSSSSEDSGLDVMKEEGEDVGVLAVPTSRVDSLLKS
ncbi:hypothetical protein BC832DRAFT_205472 [Gaertneriomyces semiglobifer]|nr:hypothetical protein BC832DRAFT_205472 [Gaertneriomyces semiglobifer]